MLKYLITPDGVCVLSCEGRAGIVSVHYSKKELFQIGCGKKLPPEVEINKTRYQKIASLTFTQLESIVKKRIDCWQGGHRTHIHRNSKPMVEEFNLTQERLDHSLVLAHDCLTFNFPNQSFILQDLFYLESQNKHLIRVIKSFDKKLRIKRITQIKRFQYKKQVIQELIEKKLNTKAKLRSGLIHTKDSLVKSIIHGLLDPSLRLKSIISNSTPNLPDIQLEIVDITDRFIKTRIYYENK